MTDDLERRKQLARMVFASMDGIPPVAVVMVATVLSLAGRIGADDALESLGQTLDWFAQDLTVTGEVSGLVVLKMAYVLRRLDQAFVDRLEGVTVPPWPAIARAVSGAGERLETLLTAPVAGCLSAVVVDDS